MEKQAVQDKHTLFSKLLTGTVFGFVVTCIFLVWGDLQNVLDTITSIPVWMFAASVLLTLTSYGIRLGKWIFMLKKLDIHVPFAENTRIFFIGLSLSITPGKIGELLKSVLLKKVADVDMTRSAPAVLADRLADLIAMAFLIGVGVMAFSIGTLSFVFFTGIIVLFIILIQVKPFALWGIDQLTRLSFLNKKKEPLSKLYLGTYELLKLPVLTVTSLLSLAAWLLECLSLSIMIEALDIDLGILESIAIFSIGTVAGALSMLPGGLGAAEGSMTGLFLLFGVAKGTAVSLTFLIRLVTLWLGVAIGLVFLLKHKKKYLQ